MIKVFAITSFVSRDSGGLSSIHATQELAEKELERLNTLGSKLDQEYEIEEMEVRGLDFVSADQQRKLDAWIAENEQCIESAYGRDWASGFNAGTKLAAEVIRQGNWTWAEYQEHLKALAGHRP